MNQNLKLYDDNFISSLTDSEGNKTLNKEFINCFLTNYRSMALNEKGLPQYSFFENSFNKTMDYYFNTDVKEYKIIDLGEDLKIIRKLVIEDIKTFNPEEKEIKRIETELIKKIDYFATAEYREFYQSNKEKLKNLNTVILENKTRKSISTGFENLDTVLDGGFYPGLYFLGATSSAGKTTFVLQVADQIAKAGNDVIYFSLEMGSYELIAKSLARTMYQISNKNKELCSTARNILNGGVTLNTKRNENFIKAGDEYLKYCDNIFIHEGIGNITVSKIKTIIENYTKLHEKRPVVIIDYLQILAPEKEDYKITEKQVLDKLVLELKRLSRDLDITVIGISSFSRSAYNQSVSMASFKESGAIEYGADVLLGLQLYGMEEFNGDLNSKKSVELKTLYSECEKNAGEGGENIIQIKLLKNRFGKKGSVYFNYCPMFETFTPNTNIEE